MSVETTTKYYGRVTAVHRKLAGSSLAVALVGGETSITLEDVFDFADGGGTGLVLADDTNAAETFSYTDVDRTANQLTGVVWGTGGAHAAGAFVSADSAGEAFDTWAFISREGYDDGDVQALVPHRLQDVFALAEGIYDQGTGAAVSYEFDGSTFSVVDILTQQLAVDGSAIDGSTITGVTASPGTDGGTPSTPSVTLVQGPGWLQAKWSPSTGTNDLLAYHVFIRDGADPTTGDSTYLVGTTSAASLVISTLADGVTALTTADTYHVVVIAYSLFAGGGTSAASAVATGSPGAIDGNVTTISHLAAGNITSGDIAAARMETNFLSAATATITTLDAITATLGTMTSGTIIGGTIETATTGQRVVLDVNGLHLYDSSGNTIAELSTDTTKAVAAYFSGTISASGGLTASAVQLSGTSNQIQGGGALVPQSGVSQPTSSPGLALAAGGSLSATTTYYVSYAWATINELNSLNQASFETDVTTGIAKLIGTEAVTQDTTASNVQAGAASLKCVTAATSGSGVLIGTASGATTSDHAVVAGQQYTLSMYLKENGGGAQLQLKINWKNSSGTVLSTSTGSATSITTSFVQYSLTATAPAGAVFASVQVNTTAATISTFWVDAVQLEYGGTASAWVAPYESAPFAPSAPVRTTSSALTVNATLPVAPTSATRAKIYMGTSTFNTGGASGIYQQSITVSGSGTTAVALSSFTSTGHLSLGSGTWPTGSGAGVIQPAQAVDSTGARMGWTLEGNGRIRFVGPTVNTQFFLYDDFYYAASTYPGATQSGNAFGQTWTFNGDNTASGGSLTAGTSSTVDPGVVTASTGTSSSGRAAFRTNTSWFLGTARVRVSFYFMLDTMPGSTNSFVVNMGLLNSSTVKAPASTDNCILVTLGAADGSNNAIRLNVANGGGLATVDGTVTESAGAWHFVEFEVDAGRTAVNWWIDFTKQTAITTNIPASTTGMNLVAGIVKTAGTAARTLNVDTVSAYGDYVSG